MSPEAGLISFAALTCLAAAMKKHRTGLALPAQASPRGVRILGWVLLALAAAVAIRQTGLSMGLTAWIGQLCVAGAILVLVMSWRPAFAPVLACVALASTPLLAGV
ncbi:MAG: DUF3325 domain-containing protein [Phenylobacterium zucineum]|nr:MAG: DUF3325 domain-containing protein [Phenylobacterium zucineum]